MDMTYRFYPHGVRNPFIREIKTHEDNTLVFDGYFYVDQKDLPVQRIMGRFSEETTDEDGNTYRSLLTSSHIEIYEKLSGEDTSYYGEPKGKDISGNEYDSDEGVVLFPTEITTLKYRVLKSDLTKLERDMILESIKEGERTREKQRVDEMMAKLDDLE